MKRRACSFIALTLVLLAMRAPAEDQPSKPPSDRIPATLPLDAVPLGLDSLPPVPADNQLTEPRVALGRRLFFDPALSADGSLSCASCHLPRFGFANRDPLAVGINSTRGLRNAPSLVNRAYGLKFFWDGRAASLEEQALQPIENPQELGTTVDAVLARLAGDATYQASFQRAYPDGVSRANLARALASFQRVLLSGNSAVDRFQAGDARALPADARTGLWVFESRGRCWKCHSGSNYTDEAFHNTGVSWGKEPLDLGRFRVTGGEQDRGRFKTPTLREIAHTGPYMHDGSLNTLREVVEFYNQGGGRNPYLDVEIQPLKLSSREVRALVAFLAALSGDAAWRPLQQLTQDPGRTSQ